LRFRNACQSFASALVCDARRALALALSFSIPLTGIASFDAIRPLPTGERYIIVYAAP
jgi:hypothetical protein